MGGRVIKGALRSAPSRKVLLTLDEETNKLLLGARERSGRTKTNEALVRCTGNSGHYHLFFF
ncbi:TraY domain-containing protein [Escherichia coli]|uniref:TraY domain-containing protein n=1 Tax=Escherichia coli TaxID=562 RepID=UPI00207BB8CB|nr:TraY domain-containing protein [Escherichia coli]